MCVPAGLKAKFLTELSQTSCPLSGALLFFPLGEHFNRGLAGERTFWSRFCDPYCYLYRA